MTDTQIAEKIAEAHAWLDGETYLMTESRTDVWPSRGLVSVTCEWRRSDGGQITTRKEMPWTDERQVEAVRSMANTILAQHEPIATIPPELQS